MKKLIMLALLLVCLSPQNVHSNSGFYISYDKETNQQELCRGSLLSLLYPYISNEVDKYYGFPKQFDLYNAKILSIKKTPERFEYEIIVQVETFTGAHNPPQGIETITILTSPMGTKTTNYNHNNEEVVTTAAPLNMKVYRYDEYGYEVAYPKNYHISISGGHSPVANPEFGMRLSLCSKYSRIILDIDSISKVSYRDKYQNVEEFLKYKQRKVKFYEDIIIDDKHNKIYKSEGDNYYFSFFENEKYIFQLSSSSEKFLKKIMATFTFI